MAQFVKGIGLCCEVIQAHPMITMLYAIILFIKDLQLSYLNGTSHNGHPKLVRK